MARINLLPWREEQRQERQKQFVIAVVASAIFAVAVLYGAVIFFDNLLEEQNNRNTFLKKEVAKLVRAIKEVDVLERERKNLLARMQAIQNLQASRSKSVKVLDALVRTVPEGVYLTKVMRKNKVLTMSGVATSNGQVSGFMRRLEKNDQFLEPKLTVVQRTSNKEDDLHMTFSLSVKESSIEDGGD